MVKRYRIIDDDNNFEDEEGYWIFYGDYKKLEDVLVSVKNILSDALDIDGVAEHEVSLPIMKAHHLLTVALSQEKKDG